MIETTDHDAGPPLLYVGEVGHLVQVQIDGHRWALLLPGDAVAELLVGTEPGAA